jgi:hypothetical protein
MRPEKASVLSETTGNAIVQAKNKMALRFIVVSYASEGSTNPIIVPSPELLLRR